MKFVEEYGVHGQPILVKKGKMDSYNGHAGQTHVDTATDWIIYHLTQPNGSVREAKMLAKYVVAKRFPNRVNL